MPLRKTSLSFTRIVFSLLLFLGAGSISAACSKSQADTMTVSAPVTSTIPTTDSMPNTDPRRYLALGDSYTIGTSVTEGERYPVQTAALLKAQGLNFTSPDIIATNGWTTGDLLNGISSSTFKGPYDAVSLLIGVNNQYQGRSIDEYKQQFTTLLQKAIQYANGLPDHVVVVSIPDYSVTPFAKGRDMQAIAAAIDAFNDANKAIAATYKVGYLYITEDSRKAATDLSLVAADSLHFSGKEYAVWSAKLAAMIKAVLK